jgi:hypothetical protein
MKFKILNGEPLQFYDSAANLMGTIQVSGSGGDLYIRPDSGSSRNVIIGNSDTVGNVEFGITSSPVNLKLLGGGTLTSNGNILYIGESSTNDRVIISGATFTSSLQITGSLRVSGSAYAQYFVGDGSGLTNVAAAIAIKDEGVQLTPAVAAIDFVGSGVSASVAGGNVTVTITSGGGGSTDTGSLLTTASFSNPNLTFTEGDGTTFAINLSTLQPATASFALTASYALNAGGSTINTGSFVTTSSFNSFTSSYTTGSFTGSFIGIFTGTASYSTTAATASYVLNAISASFASTASFVNPLNQSVFISASLEVTGSVNILQNVTASRAIISGSTNTASGSILTVIGSGSAQPIFTVVGSSGELFSITDSLSGSLFSVNDISGLPILEVFSDSTTVVGDYQAPSLLTTKAATLNVGNTLIYSIPTASYAAAWFDYTITSASNARCGTIMAMRGNGNLVYTETTTTDIGSTAGVAFMVMITGSNMSLTGSATSPSWSFKSIIRSI